MARGRTRQLRAVLATALAGALACGLAACSDDSGAQPSPGPSSSTTTSLPPEQKVDLTFGVFGNHDEVSTYEEMAQGFTSLVAQAKVKVESWPDRVAMLRDLRAGAPVPDVFLASRDDLAYLQSHQVLQPVDELLDERGVDFGDDYLRATLTAFASDNRLLCLPYSVSPQVVYYNTHLVRFAQMLRRGIDAPDDEKSWTLAQFDNAARFAVRRRGATAGFYVPPTLDGLAPFVYSGGGDVFDDDTTPTATAFASGSTVSALGQALPVLRDPRLTLSQGQLSEHPPLWWFEHGKLAMLQGDRSLVPPLRQRLGLDFDVMPMPSVDKARTVAGLDGICVSRTAGDLSTAADFMVYATSKDALSLVARDGWVQPANQAVALSPDFQQPGHLPVHADVFTNTQSKIVFPPVVDRWSRLRATLDPLVADLFTDPVLDLPVMTQRIDEASRPVLAPPASPSATP